ncbi:MAG: hypothetical protein US86_C0001G0301 [Candidatus Daviesbacteria bacterium GW2011_GWA2_38_24]|uniref:Uncharacterized protein n=1 Tax=Candidatus Daviesbacteria bacterium GW2011_GWA2_38_24 TaxID=1618422 RepID=A0A0G0M141_9BACT|nr:MAG: hypothetical protein US86_C0001G0301 [Candidatus Daviesbacteria bacterium GW2011_GWA2_38_24]KKQ79921.1 MAG: hypothetical protein UT01_C0024G0002 [Candidatus Daviesbacteria bacterium GW2011_GWA1_38_7]
MGIETESAGPEIVGHINQDGTRVNYSRREWVRVTKHQAPETIGVSLPRKPDRMLMAGWSKPLGRKK